MFTLKEIGYRFESYFPRWFSPFIALMIILFGIGLSVICP